MAQPNGHIMYVDKDSLDDIMSGAKTIECKLYDLRHQNINVAETISFEDGTRVCLCKVVKMVVYDNLRDLVKTENINSIFPNAKTIEQATELCLSGIAYANHRAYKWVAIHFAK